tara:strand:+ start:14357 stop:14968 length:612 start_codon:yes stop_codon:yes gene_type:complete
MTLFYTLDLLGTVAFAISGALVAINKKFDPFGVFIIAFVTAVGGGTLRDVLIGIQPVSWMNNITYVFAIGIAVFVAIIFRNKLKYLSKSLFLFDTIGLGVFTIIGTEIGINANFHPVISIALGTISASFGGVLRDILCNDIPVIFRKEIYATACIFGAITFIILHSFNINESIIYVSTILIVIIIRLIAVRFHLSLPTFYSKN